MALIGLLAALLIKHFIADFCVQSDAMVSGKGVYGDKSGISHAVMHSAMTLIVLLIFGVGLGLALVLVCIEATIHYHVDWAKARFIDDYASDPSKRPYWMAVGADQLLHHLTLLGIAAFVVAGV